MKVVILAAGFGTRLERDLKNAGKDGPYHDLVGVPKPLLPIGKVTLIDRWMHILQATGFSGQDIYVVTNGANQSKFEEWSSQWPGVKLVCDGALCNESRTGAVGCMHLATTHFDTLDDTLIIAGDTLFTQSFNLSNLLEKFNSNKTLNCDASLLVHVPCPDDLVHKYGILETDPASSIVVEFKEKPKASETLSRKQCPCFYILNKQSLPLLSTFLEEKKDEDLSVRDATGTFISYLIHRMPVYAEQLDGRFDVGGLQTYIECHNHFLQQDQDSS